MAAKRGFIAGVLLVLLTAGAFSPAFFNGFVEWDDPAYVLEDPHIRQLNAANLRQIFFTSQEYNYHPLSRLSYALEYSSFKKNPSGYHATNIVLHLANTLLVFWLFRLITGSMAVAWIVAALFGVHPMHVESVAWISERRDVLYAFFFLWSLITYIQYRIRGKPSLYFLSLLFFLCSVLSKAMAVPLPLVLVLIERVFAARFARKKYFALIAPFAALAVIFFGITLGIRHHAADIVIQQKIDMPQQLAYVIFSLGFYFWKIVLPFRLSALYPYPAAIPFIYHAAALAFAGGTAAALIAMRRHLSSKIIFGFGLFFITLVPVLPWVPQYTALSGMYDRYTYIAALGIFYPAAAGICRLARRRSGRTARRALAAAGCLVLALLSVLTFQRCRVWRDSYTLWDNTARHFPHSAMAYTNRGYFLLGKKDYAKAEADFMRALAIDGKYAMAYNNLGFLYLTLEKYPQAEEMLLKSLQYNPSFNESQSLLIELYVRTNNHRAMVSVCSDIIRAQPAHRIAQLNLCNAHGFLGEYAQALPSCQKAVLLDETDARARYSLAVVLAFLGRRDEALEHCRRAEKAGCSPGALDVSLRLSGQQDEHVLNR